MLNKSWLEGEIKNLKFSLGMATATQIIFGLVMLIALLQIFTPDKDSAFFWITYFGFWFFTFYRRWMRYKLAEFEERLAQLNSTNQKTEHESPEGKLYS